MKHPSKHPLVRWILPMLMVASASAASLDYAEYVITANDAALDPGLGHGISIPIEGAPVSTSLSFTVPAEALADLTPGNYRLSVRVRDTEGNWTFNPARTFRIESPLPSLPAAEGPLQSEWIFVSSNSHGGSAGTITLSGNSTTLGANAQSFTAADLASLGPGVHRAAVRARFSGSTWSPAVSRTFVIPDATEGEAYYARWYVRNAQGDVLVSGDLGDQPLAEFPAWFTGKLPLADAPAGDFECLVALENFVGFPAEIESRSFQLVSHRLFWETNYFTDPAERGNPLISGPAADPNSDGWSNLQSFVLGIDPETPASATPLRVDPNGPAARCDIPSSLPPGSRVTIEGSPDLVTTFEPLAEIAAPFELIPVPAITARTFVDFGAGPSVVSVLPPPEPEWETSGFFRLGITFDDPWIFDHPIDDE